MADTKKAPAAQAAAERFIKVFQTSTSIEEIAKELGKSKGYVYGRAAVFRSAGIELRRFQVGRPRERPQRPERFAHLDLVRLRELAAKLGETAPPPKRKRQVRKALKDYLLHGVSPSEDAA